MAKDRGIRTTSDKPIYDGRRVKVSFFDRLFNPGVYDECEESNRAVQSMLDGEFPVRFGDRVQKNTKTCNTNKMNESELTAGIDKINARLLELREYSVKLSDLSRDIDGKIKEVSRNEGELSVELRRLKNLKSSLYRQLDIPDSI